MAAGSLTPRRAQQLSRQLSRRSARSNAGVGFLLLGFFKPGPYLARGPRFPSCGPQNRTQHETRVIPYSERAKNESIKQCHGPRPAARTAFHLVRETSDHETMGGKLFEIAQLLHMAIRNLTAGFVAFPDD